MSSNLIESGLYGKTLTQIEELTKILDAASGTPAIPPPFETLLQAKLDLLRLCEPDPVDHVDIQIARLHQIVGIRVRLEKNHMPDRTWSSIDISLVAQLNRVLSLLSQEQNWCIDVLDVLTRTRYRLGSTTIDIDWIPWEICYRNLIDHFLKENGGQDLM